MTKLLADRMGTVEEYYFSKKLREIATLQASGKDIINLGIGSPDLPPSDRVIATLREESAPASNHQYQSYKGIPELRQAFSDWYKRNYSVYLDPETQVLPLMGSKEGIMHISMAFLSEGDEVLVPNPGYPTYMAASKLAGGVIRNYALNEDSGWFPNLQQLENEGLDRVKLMWANYPHMPTGKALPAEALGQLVEFARKHEIILVNDNPYSFILNDQPQSILSAALSDDYVLELNSLSKSHNMAGWRLGMLGGNATLVQHVLTFKSNMDSGMFLPIQKAGITALDLGQEWYDELNAVYDRRRLQAWKFLDMVHCTYSQEATGMFVWGKVPKAVENGLELADKLLYECGLFITPGFIFGSEGDHYVRVSLCTPEETWLKAINRITKLEKTHS